MGLIDQAELKKQMYSSLRKSRLRIVSCLPRKTGIAVMKEGRMAMFNGQVSRAEKSFRRRVELAQQRGAKDAMSLVLSLREGTVRLLNSSSVTSLSSQK